MSTGCWSLDIVPPGVPDSKEHLVTITITITSCGNDIDISEKLCVLVKTLFWCQLVVGAQILCLLVSQTLRSTCPPSTTMLSGAILVSWSVLVRLLVCCLQRFHVIEGNIILLVLRGCVCVYICFPVNMMYVGCVQVCAHAFA